MLKNKRTIAILLCLLLLWPAAVGAQTIRQNFEWVVAKRLTVTIGGATIQQGGLTLTTGDATITSGNANITSGNATLTDGDLTLTNGDAIIGDYLKIVPQTTLTVTGTFTPTGSYQPVIAASVIGITATVGAAGQTVTIINVGTNAVTLADSGTQKLSAAAALGQYDTLTVRSDGTNWIEVARSNN